MQTSSERGAVRSLSQVRRRGGIGGTIAASLIGDRSYLVQRVGGGRRIGWTNGEWVFVASSGDSTVLGEFVKDYPYW